MSILVDPSAENRAFRFRSQGQRLRPSGFRTDIQALRALAVALVVLNHLWPHRLSGGFIGVDVFFVISGFLITSHLAKELRASGRIGLVTFYARRVRRLMPAAFLVLAASLLLAGTALPYNRWTATVQEVLGSTFYIENWLLAAKSVNYSAMNDSATVAQHFWSLSVEEQFYLFWPLILMGLYIASGKMRKSSPGVLLAGVSVATAVTFVCSVYLTAVSPSQAYFVTQVRVWEFGIGAIVALAGSRTSFGARTCNVGSLAGFALILASAVAFGPHTPFPGWAAMVPAVGTALVILSGSAEKQLWHSRLTGAKPVQFVGSISYSLYLWHWPLIVVAPYLAGADLNAGIKLFVLLSAVVLAWLTKVFIEDRWLDRGMNTSPKPARPVFLRLAVGMTVIALMALGLGVLGTQKAGQARLLAEKLAANPCQGPSVVDRVDECGSPFTKPVALPNMASTNSYAQFPDECQNDNTLADGLSGHPASCDFSGGDPKSETVWLVGDSHAQQWQTAIFELAKERQWKLKWSYFGGCPLVDASYRGYEGQVADPAKKTSCEKWSQTVATAVERDKPSKVFVSMFSAGEQIEDGSGRPQLAQYADGLVKYWNRWIDAGAVVLPIFDPPQNGSVRSADCLALHAKNPVECAVLKNKALPQEPLKVAVEKLDSPRVRPLDLTRYFCDDTNCYSAVGGVSIYYDADHLNREVVKGLVPMFAAQVD